MEKLNHFIVDEKEYPIAFNLNVAEEIQEKYGTLDKWAELTINNEKETKIKDLKFGFTAMINEGIDIENEIKKENRSPLTLKQVGRLLTAYGLDEALQTIQDTTIEATESEETEKNA